MSIPEWDTVQKRMKETLQAHSGQMAYYFVHAHGLLHKSPIEDLMASCFAYREVISQILKIVLVKEMIDIASLVKLSENEHASVIVAPQIQLKNRRVDFLACFTFRPYGQWLLAIECDGHEFHEASKTQAAKDKRTDRAILIDGIPTMRFTGSEIWADAVSCVDEVLFYFRERSFAVFTQNQQEAS